MAFDDDSELLDLNRVLRDIHDRVQERLTPSSANGQQGGKTETDQPGFREVDYLRLNPDVAEAVHGGAFASGADHWSQRGRAEGRRAQMSGVDYTDAIRRGLDYAKGRNAQIGLLPASPPTLRGRVGAFVLRLISRCLWWHTKQLQEYNAALTNSFSLLVEFNTWLATELPGSVTQRFDSAATTIEDLERQYRLDIEKVHAYQHRLDELLRRDWDRSNELEARFQAIERRAVLQDSVDSERHAHEAKANTPNVTQSDVVALREILGSTAQRLSKQIADERTSREELNKRLSAEFESERWIMERINRRVQEVAEFEATARTQLEKQAALRQLLMEQALATEREMADHKTAALRRHIHSGIATMRTISGTVRTIEGKVRTDLNALRTEMQSLTYALKVEVQERGDPRRELSNAVAQIAQSIGDQKESVKEITDHLRASLDAEIHERERTTFTAERLHEKLESGLIGALQDRVLGLDTAAYQMQNNMASMDQRVSALMDKFQRIAPGAVEGGKLDHDDHKLDALYMVFEDTFRGTRQDIKHRQEIYLPYLSNAVVGAPDCPVLDIGCGRGEWLELLREHKLQGSGVDRNRVMVEGCRSFGLDVVEGDALYHLKQCTPDSLGAITASHVVEHLHFDLLIELLDASQRALKPGGLLILETPNPANLQVGAHTFYLDPTHRHPLPSTMLKFFVEQRGFSNVEVLPLHPYPSSYHLPNSDALSKRWNDHFYGPQDYAVIGRKA